MANALLELVFGKVRGEALKCGPYSLLRFEDGTLLADGERLAVHENHQWVIEQGRYTRMDVEARIDIRCYTGESASRTFGPYATFSSVDGVAYVEQRIFGFYDEQERDWYAYDDGRHWKAMEVKAASKPGRPTD